MARRAARRSSRSNPNPNLSPNPYPSPNSDPNPNPNPNPTQDFELRKLLAKLGIDEALAKKAGAPWTIQGGSFVMRNRLGLGLGC